MFDTVGREQAEQLYAEKILPVIQRYPNVFTVTSGSAEGSEGDGTKMVTPYSLEDFHVQGTRILSRSFTVDRARARGAMSTDGKTGGDSMEGNDGDSDSDDEEDEPSVVMVPFADMLNAAFGRTNAQLFHHSGRLVMISTQDISPGDQIFNTYGTPSPSNSELLRKYGHVDVDRLDESLLRRMPEYMRGWPFGNGADTVDVSGKLVCQAVMERFVEVGKGTLEEVDSLTDERVDWWLENGGDE